MDELNIIVNKHGFLFGGPERSAEQVIFNWLTETIGHYKGFP